MKMLHCNVFCLVVIFYEIRNELILKIDLDEANDEQTTVDNMYITFINKTDDQRLGNGTVTLDLSAKNDLFGHQLVKRNPDNTPLHVPLNIGVQTDSLGESNMNIQMVKNKGDTSKIRARLNDFRMKKRRTLVSTPNFDFPFIDFNKKYDQVYGHYDEYRRNIPDYSMIGREQKIFQALTKQNELMERIANNLLLREEKKKKIARSYFDDILDSVEKRQTTVQKNKTKATTTNKQVTTIRTVIDETEIREALKKDPFIKRILSMAGRKKKEYEKNKAKDNDFLV